MILNLNENGAIISYVNSDLTFFNPYIEDDVVDSVEINDFDQTTIFDHYYDNGLKLIENKQVIYRDYYKNEQDLQAKQMMEQSARVSFLETLDDSKAAKIPSCYDPWEIDKLYKVGDRCECGGKLWKCRQEHTSQKNWKPSINTASLWEVIDVEHAGTVDDPIPYDMTMVVHAGKYYVENNIVYECIRDSGIPLYASCASLVGNYFNVYVE